jgi:sortase A
MAPLKTESPAFRVWPERFLLTLGVALLLFYAGAWVDRYLAARQLQALEQLASSLNARKPAPSVSIAAAPGGEQTSPPRQAIARKPGDPVGFLRIPRIHLDVPVLEGTSTLTLNRGAGRIEGTAQPGDNGNIAIAGHRDSFFRGLRDVRVGDTVEFGTPAAISVYVVDRIQIVTPERVDVLRTAGRASLTLVTCYPFHYFGRAPQRYVVTAVLSGPADAPHAAEVPAPANPAP